MKTKKQKSANKAVQSAEHDVPESYFGNILMSSQQVIALIRSVADKDRVDPVDRDGEFITCTPQEFARAIAKAKHDL